MDFTAAINQLMTEVDRIGTVDVATAVRRSLLSNFIIDEFQDIWRDNGEPWPFKDTSGTVTIPATIGKVILPADWSEFGVYGGVYLRTTGERIDPKSPQEIRDKQRKLNHIEAAPECYAIFGMDPATFRLYIQTAKSNVDVILDLDYMPVPPTLDEGANVNNLKRLPEEYHQSVLMNRVKARAYESRGDETANVYRAIGMRGMSRMRSTLRPGKEGIQQLNTFSGR